MDFEGAIVFLLLPNTKGPQALDRFFPHGGESIVVVQLVDGVKPGGQLGGLLGILALVWAFDI